MKANIASLAIKLIIIKKSSWLLCLLILACCSDQNSNRNSRLEKDVSTNAGEFSSYSQSIPVTESISLITFQDSLVPIPERENSGRLIIAHGCVSVSIENSSTILTAIFQKNAQLLYENDVATGVVIDKKRILFDETFTFSGALINNIASLPELTPIPDSCLSQFHSIGVITQ